MMHPAPDPPRGGERQFAERRVRLALAGKTIRELHRGIERERRDAERMRRYAWRAVAIGATVLAVAAIANGWFAAT